MSTHTYEKNYKCSLHNINYSLSFLILIAIDLFYCHHSRFVLFSLQMICFILIS